MRAIPGGGPATARPGEPPLSPPLAPPRFADTHAHLDGYGEELEAVLTRAAAAGVSRAVAVGIDAATSRQALELARQARRRASSATAAWPELALALGLHPHSASRADRELPVLRALLAEAAKEGFPVAVGETGLDYYRDRSPRAQQRAAFWAQVEWAHQLRLPLVVHDRDAHADVLAVLEGAAPLPAGGVMHCYSGDQAYAERCLELGLYISFAGPLTFPGPGAAGLRQMAARLPLGRLLVETDCPYLAPVPRRGQRNEPALVAWTAQTLAAGRREGTRTALEALWRNAGDLFWRTGDGA